MISPRGHRVNGPIDDEMLVHLSRSRCIIKIPGIFIHRMQHSTQNLGSLHVFKKNGHEWAGRSHQVWQEQRRRFILSCWSQPLTQHLSFLSFGLIYFNFYGGPLDLSLSAAIIWFESRWARALCTARWWMSHAASERGSQVDCITYRAVRDIHPHQAKAVAAVCIWDEAARLLDTPSSSMGQRAARADKFSSPCPSKCFYRQSFTASFCLVLKIAVYQPSKECYTGMNGNEKHPHIPRREKWGFYFFFTLSICNFLLFIKPGSAQSSPAQNKGKYHVTVHVTPCFHIWRGRDLFGELWGESDHKSNLIFLHSNYIKLTDLNIQEFNLHPAYFKK